MVRLLKDWGISRSSPLLLPARAAEAVRTGT